MPTPIELLKARMRTRRGREAVDQLFADDRLLARRAVEDVVNDLCDPTVCEGLNREFWFAPIGSVLREAMWKATQEDRLSIAEAAALLFAEKERANTRLVAVHHLIKRGILRAWYKPDLAFEGTNYGLRVKDPANKWDAPGLRYLIRSEVENFAAPVKI